MLLRHTSLMERDLGGTLGSRVLSQLIYLSYALYEHEIEHEI